MNLNCYVCGEMLMKEFYLVSMQKDSDRVFVVSAKCLPLIQSGDTVAQHVARTPLKRVVCTTLSRT